MKKSVKKMYKEAIKNQDFNTEMKDQDPIGYYKPNFFSDEVAKITYAAAYYGWLLGKGNYNRKNYI